MTKHIFVTGGVVSSIGKGLTSASIGMLLEARGLRVRMQKLDPYINVDPGTMSPYQHGEVYVLDDGSETDLDLGHYERFTDGPLTRDSNYTTGQIYLSVIEKERKGQFLGKTVQVIPHITDEIKSVIRKVGEQDVVSSLKSVAPSGILKACRFSKQFGSIRSSPDTKTVCLFMTLVPYLKAAGEHKDKPTQHSVGQLRQIGIQPDILICRCERPFHAMNAKRLLCFAI
ncbi:MAG: CTP synthase [Pirellulaceae bacterium]